MTTQIQTAKTSQHEPENVAMANLHPYFPHFGVLVTSQSCVGTKLLSLSSPLSGRRWWIDGRIGPDMFRHQVGVRTESVTGPFDLDDDGVMQESIKQRSGDDGISEDVGHSAKPRLEVRIMAPFSYRALTS